jgi:hypothetical protein
MEIRFPERTYQALTGPHFRRQPHYRKAYWASILGGSLVGQGILRGSVSRSLDAPSVELLAHLLFRASAA